MTAEQLKDMTPEEIAALITNQEKDIESLTAERDSFSEENEKLLKEKEDAAKELAETKKLNFTLARQTSRDEKSAEELLNEMFK